ncbi:MAG: cytochrome c oxidase subunit 3, partial [Burkholderiales bacterium]
MTQQPGHYYVPSPSYWPIFGSAALLCMALGATLWMNNQAQIGPWVLVLGASILIYMMFGWFGTVIRESEEDKFNKQVDLSFRWGMSWFIFSEVMFFAAFFGALFYMRVLSVPWLGDFDHKILWPDFTAGWPVSGPGIKETFTPMAAWGIPAINTL